MPKVGGWEGCAKFTVLQLDLQFLMKFNYSLIKMSRYSKLKHKRNILTLGFREIYVLGNDKGRDNMFFECHFCVRETCTLFD